MKLSTRRESTGSPTHWQAECERLFAAEVDLSRKRLALGAELPSLIASAGEAKLNAHLDGSEATNPGQSVESVRIELSIIDAAINVARSKRYDALRQIHVAEASQMRAEASRFREQAAEHLQVTKRLLAELEAHEECRFVPDGPPTVGDGLRLQPGTYRRSVSDRLNGQAAQLEADADARENKRLLDWGELQGIYSPSELVEAIIEQGPFHMGPPLVQLHDWAMSTLQKSGKNRLPCRVTWARGELSSSDVVRSTA